MEKVLPVVSLKPSVPIVLSCSDYFAPYGCVFLYSLLSYIFPDNFYDIIVFTKDMEETNKERWVNLVKSYSNVSLRFYNIKPIFEQYNLNINHHFGIESYFKLLIPFIIDGYSKVCYFDCDMVIRDDVAQLMSVELYDNYIAGCIDSVIAGAINDKNAPAFNGLGWGSYARSILKMADPMKYLNTGVLVFNMHKFREDFTLEKILNFADEGQFSLLDQDALNSLCNPKVVVLCQAWNMTTDQAGLKLPYIQKAPAEIYNEYIKARLDRKTVHYADLYKPWKFPIEDLGYEFWADAKKTVYFEMILHRMSNDLYDKSVNPHYIQKIPMGIKQELKMSIHSIMNKYFPPGTKRRNIIKFIYFNLLRRRSS
jgi:lipopolysaccharide biosynthesis glycosyltransferase